MPDRKKPSRVGRPPVEKTTKKVISLTIAPALVKQIDAYAADKKISRSAAIEAAIVGLLTPKLDDSIATAEHSRAQPDGCVFATPALGSAIFY